jgi:hypothetical protein
MSKSNEVRVDGDRLASKAAREQVLAFAKAEIARMPEWKRVAYAHEAAQFEDMARVARNGR